MKLHCNLVSSRIIDTVTRIIYISVVFYRTGFSLVFHVYDNITDLVRKAKNGTAWRPDILTYENLGQSILNVSQAWLKTDSLYLQYQFDTLSSE